MDTIERADFHECLKNAAKAAEELSGDRVTFNDLDPKFQLTPDMDPEHIFPEEYEMIAELRNRLPDLKWYSDRHIVVFLCARRHNLPETEELLRKYLAKRKELGFRWKPPMVTNDEAVMKMSRNLAAARWPGTHDKYGRMVQYLFMANNVVDQSQDRYDAMTKWSFFESEWIILTEKLAYLRNGLVWLVDLKGFSITKNVDFSQGFRKWSEDIQGVFPNRIRSILIVNAGVIIKAFLAAAKLVLPAKLAKRIQVITEAEVVQTIPKYMLADTYGGDVKITWDDGIALVIKGEVAVNAHWKKVRAERRAFKQKLISEIDAEHQAKDPDLDDV